MINSLREYEVATTKPYPSAFQRIWYMVIPAAVVPTTSVAIVLLMGRVCIWVMYLGKGAAVSIPEPPAAIWYIHKDSLLESCAVNPKLDPKYGRLVTSTLAGGQEKWSGK